MQSVVHGTTQLDTEDICRCLVVVVSKGVVASFSSWYVEVTFYSQRVLDIGEARFRLSYPQWNFVSTVTMSQGRKEIIIRVWDHFYSSGDECRDLNSFWNSRNVDTVLAPTKPEVWCDIFKNSR